MTKDKSPYTFMNGIVDSIPIGLGYLSVSFGFGISAVGSGLSALISLLISLTNLTSAGQIAGVAVIASAGTFVEMALTQLTINLRYSLMSISVSQRLDPYVTVPKRALIGFGITDEIFAVAVSKPKQVGTKYMYGLIALPYVCWGLGTILGAVAGNLLPDAVKNALGIAIYGMFTAIVVPDLKKSLGVAVAAAIAAVLSCILKYVPIFSGVSVGFSIIICAVVASAVAAYFFPKKTDTAEEDTQ